MLMYFFTLAVVQLMLAIREVDAHASGAGFGACQTLEPTHGVALSGINPFTITVRRVQSDLEVTLSSTDDTEFEGFIMQARQQKGLNQNSLGVFSNFPDSTRGTFCFLHNSDTATHSDTIPKTSLTFLWTPPADIGEIIIQFHATVAIDKENWWNSIISDEVNLPLPDEAKPSSTASSKIQSSSVQPSSTLDVPTFRSVAKPSSTSSSKLQSSSVQPSSTLDVPTFRLVFIICYCTFTSVIMLY